MPNYASSFVNGAAPGVRSVDNVARYRIVKDTVNGDGSPILSNSTDTIADFAAMYASLLAEVSALASLVGLTVRVASTANVAGTYNNGSSGVNATLTAGSNVAFSAVDGVTLVAGDAVLLKNQTSGLENGIYVLTTVGDGSTPWKLTRADNANNGAELLPGLFINVSAGNANGGRAWYLTNTVAPTVGTTALSFTSWTSTGFAAPLAARKANIANHFSIKMNLLKRQFLAMNKHVKELSNQVLYVNTKGIQGPGAYPSDNYRGY